MLGGYAWLARLADKARAEKAGTNGEYVAYCPLSTGFLTHAGVGVRQFGEMIDRDAGDEEIVRFFREHVSAGKRDEANRFILEESSSSLDEQDAEEGR